MSMTDKAIEDRKWRGIVHLRRLAKDSHPVDLYNSAYYRIEERILDLLKVAGKLECYFQKVSESHENEIPSELRSAIYKENQSLCDELRVTSKYFMDVAKNLEGLASLALRER